MTSIATQAGAPPDHRPGRGVPSGVAGVACWVWGALSLVVGGALLVLFVVNRADLDGVPQPLFFRLIAPIWGLVRNWEGMRYPGLDIEPRLLVHYTNRDFDDVFLIGSALLAFTLAAALGMLGYGLGRRQLWARGGVAGLSWAVVAAVAVYAVRCCYRDVTSSGLVLLVVLAAVPAAVGGLALRGEPVDRPAAGRHRRALTRPALVLLMSAHAVLLLPAFAWAWLLAGILVRRLWLWWEA